MTRSRPPSNWYADPSGRHEKRYWDEDGWTPLVDDAGVIGHDLPVEAVVISEGTCYVEGWEVLAELIDMNDGEDGEDGDDSEDGELVALLYVMPGPTGLLADGMFPGAAHYVESDPQLIVARIGNKVRIADRSWLVHDIYQVAPGLSRTGDEDSINVVLHTTLPPPR